MMRTLLFPALLVPTLLCGLACGGALDTAGALEPLCERTVVEGVLADLVEIDGAIQPPPVHLPLVEIDDVQFRVQGRSEYDPSSRLKELAAITTELNIAIDRNTPATKVVAALEKVHSAGFRRVYLLASSASPAEPPPYADPDYARRLETEILGEGFRQERESRLAMEIAGLVGGCPEAEYALVMASSGSFENRCRFLGIKLSDALSSCPDIDAKKVLTAIQYDFRGPPKDHTSVLFELDPKGPVRTWPASTTFGEMLPTWEGRRGWWGLS